MTAAIIVCGVLMLSSIIALLVYRSTRPTDQVAPRRRELRRVQANYESAQRALNHVERLLDDHRVRINDLVFDQLNAQITRTIRDHREKMLENDK